MTERSGGRRDDGTMERVGRSVGETAGKAADVAGKMAAGMAAPLIRSAADVLGGWWSGDEAREAASAWDTDRDRRCRSHYQGQQGGTTASSTAERSYDEVRPYYQLGHTAAKNPEYSGRNFDEVEPDLRKVWAEGEAGGSESWPDARGYVEFGYGQP